MAGKSRKQKFVDAFLTCYETLDNSGREPSERKINAYWELLKKYEIKQFERAFSIAMGTRTWFPKPAELIELITGPPENLDDRAEIQAHEVVNAVRRIGGYETVEFDDPITTAVINQGFNGWNNLCDMLLDNEVKWFVKDFSRIYKSYTRSGISQNRKLPGRVEISNLAHGFSGCLPGTVEIVKILKQIGLERQ